MWIALAICGGIALFATTHLIWKARYEALKADYNRKVSEHSNQLDAKSNELKLCKKKRKETAEQLLKVTQELKALKAPRPTKGGF